MLVHCMDLAALKDAGEAPEWLSDEGLETLSKGYLLKGETPRAMYRRVANSAAKYLGIPELADKFYEYIDKNWLCLATPVASNAGTERGLTISCLTGSMMLNTPQGVCRIDEIKVGDRVLTHRGRYRKVTHVQSRQADDIYELVVQTRRTKIEITGNHPVKTNLGWVRVDELDPERHLVAANREVELLETPYVLDTHQYYEPSPEVPGRFPLHWPKQHVQVTPDVAWALGIWFAEGSITTDRNKKPTALRITMGAHEQATVDRWLAIMREHFGVSGDSYLSTTFRNGKPNLWVSAYVSGKVLSGFFTSEFGRGCKAKKPPEWISNLPKAEAEAFLRGFVDGDGCHKKQDGARSLEKFYVVLSNPYIIGTLYNLMLKLGLPCSVDFSHKKSDKNRYWSYSINCLGGFDTSKNKHVSTGIPFEDGLLYLPIRQLKKLDTEVKVYDISVEEDHSFSVAGVVVHNCYGMTVPDSVDGIFKSFHETAMLTKNGGGIGKYWGKLRGRGAEIAGNGVSDGIIPWLKVEESTLQSTAQGGVRRGSGVQYVDIDSPEIEEIIDIRRNTGDISRRCLSNSFHHAVCITDDFMQRCVEGDEKARSIWERLLITRIETGEPYIMFKDTANKMAPDCYKHYGLEISTSQLCNEIYLHSDEDHTFVCCLSSLNLARWDEWKDTDLVEVSIMFLDGIMQEFIEKADGLPGFERAVRFAKKSRALGLGVLGWHTLLQAKLIPFESFEAMQLNALIFKTIRERADDATRKLATMFGEVEWTKGFGIRNTHLLAVAPTMSNALISGGVSQGIEPIVANYFAQKTAKGTFIRKNKQLEALLESKEQNTFEVWNQINRDGGSVKNVACLTDHEKSVFATARELSQFAIIQQAAQRQVFIDQGQSLNLFFSASKTPDEKSRKLLGKYVHDVHLMAWELGLKGLYYVRADAVLSGDAVYREESDCKSCES